MALTIFDGISAITATLVRNPIEAKLLTDSYVVTPAVENNFYITIKISTAGTPVADDHFNLIVGGITRQLAFKTTPNNTGYELPLQGSDSITAYAQILQDSFRGCPVFLNNWEITAEVIMGDIYIIFTSAVDITAKAVIASNPSRYILNNIPGAAPLYLENYLANVALFCEKINLSNDYEKIIDLYSFPFKMEDDYIVTFRLDRLLYDYMEKTYSENLKTALPFSFNYPNANHLVKRFYYRYYESYGNPSVKYMVKNSSTYNGLLSGLGHLSFKLDNSFSTSPFRFLHHYNIDENTQMIKQYVDIDQTVWVYFMFNPSDSYTWDMITKIYKVVYFNDGTTYTDEFANPTDFIVPINTCKTFFLPAGYYYRGVGLHNTAEKKAYMWDICIEFDEEKVVSKRFILDCCDAQYKTCLMYQNSKGGYDTVMLTAPKEFSFDINDGKEVERILPAYYEKFDSQYEATTPKVRQTIKANLGYKKTTDFDSMKEILMSKHVFIIPKYDDEMFIPININRKSVVLESEDDFEKNFSFEFSPAHDFKNLENDLWLK